jgi:glycosyltransferase involved in cell wall biosynthesis
MKLACVVHRFGAEVAGGSEGHCRAIAERLASRHDVTVLTTCAKDHITWKNEYPEGLAEIGPLRVHRFAVARTRSLFRFAEQSEIVFGGKASEHEQEEWFRANGPETPALVDFLSRSGAEYDRVLFWSFRYYHTYFGLPVVADRAVLLPTAEEDPAMRLDVLDQLFSLPAGFLFLTPEEHALVARRSSRPLAPSSVIGSGLDPITRPPSSSLLLDRLGVVAPFILYLGRIDPNKGCGTLLGEFRKYRGETDGPLQLVMAGPANMPIPDDPAIRPLGFVDEHVREALLSNAAVLVVPSPFESLSLALLEAWNHGVPGLVNGHCAVLRGQALRSNGALYYRDFGEFAAGLNLLLGNPATARRLGEQGLAYVNREYRWPHVMAKIESLLSAVGAHAAGTGHRIP